MSGLDAAKLAASALLASRQAYAPYSGFHVGAALLFADGAIVTGSNVENASYGLSLCAEANAIAKAMGEGRRGGLIAVALAGRKPNEANEAVRPSLLHISDPTRLWGSSYCRFFFAKKI